MPVLVRDAVATDLPVLADRRLRMFRDMGVDDEERLAALAERQGPWMAESFADGTLSGLVAEEDGRPVGGLYVVWLRVPPSLHQTACIEARVFGLFVEPENRRQGVASALVTRVLEQARDAGVRVVTLHASPAGRPLYEKLGFEQTSEMRVILGTGHDAMDDLGEEAG